MTLRGDLRLGWFGYALCNVGVALGTLPFTLLLLYYLTQIAGIPAGLAGVIIALPKLWDALIDPVFGGWIDQVSVQMGRRWPAIAVSVLLFAGTLVAMFALPVGLPIWQLAALAVLLLILSSIAQTGIGVSQYAIAPEMTKNPLQLNGLLATAAVAGQVFSVGGGLALPLIVAAAGGGRFGYGIMAVAVAGVAMIAFFLFILSTRNIPVRPAGDGAETTPIWRSLRQTTGNHAFYNLLGLVVCLNCSIALMLGFLPFANQYVLAGDSKSLAFLEGALGLAVLLGLIIAPLVARHVPPLIAMLASNVATAVAMIALVGAAAAPLWATLAGLAVIGLGAGVVGVLIQTSILKAAQQKLADGTVVALGFYLGIMVAAIKLGSSAGAFVSGQLLHAVGFVSGAAIQSTDAMIGVRMGYTIAPAVFVAASTLFLLRNLAQERRIARHAARLE